MHFTLSPRTNAALIVLEAALALGCHRQQVPLRCLCGAASPRPGSAPASFRASLYVTLFARSRSQRQHLKFARHLLPQSPGKQLSHCFGQQGWPCSNVSLWQQVRHNPDIAGRLCHFCTRAGSHCLSGALCIARRVAAVRAGTRTLM